MDATPSVMRIGVLGAMAQKRSECPIAWGAAHSRAFETWNNTYATHHPLTIACSSKDRMALEWLLKVPQLSLLRTNALQTAVSKGWAVGVRMLLESGKPYAPTDGGWAVYLACVTRRMTILDNLIAHGCELQSNEACIEETGAYLCNDEFGLHVYDEPANTPDVTSCVKRVCRLGLEVPARWLIARYQVCLWDEKFHNAWVRVFALNDFKITDLLPTLLTEQAQYAHHGLLEELCYGAFSSEMPHNFEFAARFDYNPSTALKTGECRLYYLLAANCWMDQPVDMSAICEYARSLYSGHAKDQMLAGMSLVTAAAVNRCREGPAIPELTCNRTRPYLMPVQSAATPQFVRFKAVSKRKRGV